MVEFRKHTEEGCCFLSIQIYSSYYVQRSIDLSDSIPQYTIYNRVFHKLVFYLAGTRTSIVQYGADIQWRISIIQLVVRLVFSAYPWCVSVPSSVVDLCLVHCGPKSTVDCCCVHF